MHDLGVIPKVRIMDGKEVRGFKVLVGGGLGAQPFLAKTAFEFLEADQLIPYIESVLRVFDRHGERSSRHKARIKFLIQKIGMEEFERLVKEEYKAIKVQDRSRSIMLHGLADAALPADGFSTAPAFTIKKPAAVRGLEKDQHLRTEAKRLFRRIYPCAIGRHQLAHPAAGWLKSCARGGRRCTRDREPGPAA